jgi:hypothetical protein
MPAELIMTSEVKMQTQRDNNLPPSRLLTMQEGIMEWQTELAFLKKKSALLQVLIRASGLFNTGPARVGEPLQKELARLVNVTFPAFELKLEDYKGTLELLNILPPEGANNRYIEFRGLRQEWKNIYQSYSTLEIKILKALIAEHPVIIF